MQRWLDFSDGERGVAFLNNGKYGYDASSHGVRLSLMRAPTHRDGKRIGLGEFSFSYALMPHKGDWKEGGVTQRGVEFNHDLISTFASPHQGFPLEGRSLFSIHPSNVLITAIKSAEESSGIVLRLYESCGKATVVDLDARARISRVRECNLIEAPIPGACSYRQTSDHSVEVAMRPFEIKTLLLETEPLLT